MPLRDYRCTGCGAVFELLSRSQKPAEARCPACGFEGRQVFSTFGLKIYKIDRSNFALIAPLGPDGKPQTLVEAQRRKDVDAYRPGEHERMLVHEAETNAHRERVLKERAKREAWREVSAKTRTVVRG